MVGVHGGSKGCVRCRKRKVKCDETRPTCKRCEKGGYDCGGYRDLFQADSRSGSKTASRSKALTSRTGQLWTLAEVTPPRSERSWSPGEVQIEHAEVGLLGPLRPQYLDLRPFSEDFCVSYTNSHLMKGSGDAQQNWAIPGITSFNENDLVRDCILALSFSFFGQQYSDKYTLSRGVSLYGTTLGRLNMALGDKVQSLSVPTLESIMVLTLYEVLMGTNMKSFIAHVLGLETLLKMLGPERVAESRQALELLEISRPVVVSACTLSIKDTVLSAPEWKTIPWSKGLKTKSDLQQLYDAMVDLPGLTMHVCDPVSAGLRLRMSGAQDLDMLYMRAFRTLTAYQSWFSDWNKRHSGHMLEFTPIWAPSGWLEGNLELPWSKVWHFSAIVVAQAYTVYQAGVIILTRMLYNLEQSGLLNVEYQALDREPEIQHAAIEICRSVEWLLDEQRRGAGGLYLLMPGRCAWKTLADGSGAQRWMLAATKDIGKAHKGGWSMAAPMSRPLTNIYGLNGTQRIDVPEATA